MKIIIAPETEHYYESITRLHITAFKGDREVKLVEKLRKTTEYILKLSLVAKYENEIVIDS
jgi:predicted N-acetyltransferase YhbS